MLSKPRLRVAAWLRLPAASASEDQYRPGGTSISSSPGAPPNRPQPFRCDRGDHPGGSTGTCTRTGAGMRRRQARDATSWLTLCH